MSLNTFIPSKEDLSDAFAFGIQGKTLTFCILLTVATNTCVYLEEYRVLFLIGWLFISAVLFMIELNIIRSSSNLTFCANTTCSLNELFYPLIQLLLCSILLFSPAAIALLCQCSNSTLFNLLLATGFFLFPFACLITAIQKPFRICLQAVISNFALYVFACVLLACPFFILPHLLPELFSISEISQSIAKNHITASVYTFLGTLFFSITSRILGTIGQFAESHTSEFPTEN